MRAVRMGLAMGAALAMALPATVASAGASSYEDVEVAQFFENEDYVLFTGPRFEQGCLDEGFVESQAHVVRPSEERMIGRTSFQDQMHLYDVSEYDIDSGIELVEIACTALSTGEGAPPIPIASGEGTVTFRLQITDTPNGFIERVHDNVRGTVVTESGDEWSVHGRVKYTITVEGDDFESDVRLDDLDVRT